jgi:crotonobetainyl-CoA:carnitine CoA-transferase CaiB-like acyl-CoA transferase
VPTEGETVNDGDTDAAVAVDANGLRTLEGVTVVEAGTMISGSMVGTSFAEFGANVKKVNTPTAATTCATSGRRSTVLASGGSTSAGISARSL